MKRYILGVSSVLVAFAFLVLPTFVSAAGPWYVDSSSGLDANDCLSPASACLTIQGAITKASAGDTINVANGTYSGSINVTANGIQIVGESEAGVVFTENAGTPFGQGVSINGFSNVAISNMTFSVPVGAPISYALQGYKADGLTLSNVTFNGPGKTSTHIGGVDLNTSNNVVLNNVTSTGFYKNGFAYTAQYDPPDTAANAVTFNGVTAANNGWTGISFYTVGNDHSPASTGGAHSITGVQFTGANSVSGNGAGIHIEGDNDAHEGAAATPAYTVTTDGTTLDLSHVAFSGNTNYDIINYQTAPVNAIGATFDPGNITGDAMTPEQRTTEDSKINDQLDHPALGLVTYWTPVAPFQPQVHIFKYLDGVQATAQSANSAAFPMETTFTSPNLGSYTDAPFTLGPTGWGPADSAYEASFVGSDAGADYQAEEVLTTPLVGEMCDGSHTYALVGYTTGDTLEAAASAAPSLDSTPSFTDLQSDQYVIVWNKTCPTTGSLVVEKDTIGGNGTFMFTGDNGIGSFPITTTGTAAGGSGTSQIFSNLAPGTYHVTELAQNGWTMTDSDCSAVEVTAGNTTMCTVTNTKNKKLGAIYGTKYEDWDGDGKPFERRWENGLSGWTIYLDTNNNNQLDSGEPSTVTDSHGNYHFVGLVAGTYHVREVQQAGWTQTYPSANFANDEYTIALAAGQVAKKKDFGNFKLGTISGMKYEDKNGNGRKNAGEGGLAGWTIQLKKGNSVVATAITNAGGAYSFTDLAAGVYKLSEVMKPGWKQTDHPSPVRVVSATNAQHKDFGNKKIVAH